MSAFFKVCKDCPDRKVGCHEICERYLEEKARYEEIKKSRRLEGEYNTYAKASALERKIKCQKKK